MKIHKEGYKILRNEIIIFSLINYISYWNFELIFYYFILVLTIIMFIISIYFFRIPNRRFNIKNGVIYSPCDGKVVSIKEETEMEYFNEKRIQISIFMSPLNIHNQLYPISGNIEYTKYHPGKYLVAWHPKSSLLNERSSIVINNQKISILLTQIAGFLARRIITYSKVGDSAVACNEYGFIKFGSRVDISLPINSKISIKIGEKVKGGKSIIANY